MFRWELPLTPHGLLFWQLPKALSGGCLRAYTSSHKKVTSIDYFLLGDFSVEVCCGVVAASRDQSEKLSGVNVPSLLFVFVRYFMRLICELVGKAGGAH